MIDSAVESDFPALQPLAVFLGLVFGAAGVAIAYTILGDVRCAPFEFLKRQRFRIFGSIIRINHGLRNDVRISKFPICGRISRKTSDGYWSILPTCKLRMSETGSGPLDHILRARSRSNEDSSEGCRCPRRTTLGRTRDKSWMRVQPQK